jgi:hypothetical protein
VGEFCEVECSDVVRSKVECSDGVCSEVECSDEERYDNLTSVIIWNE